ncbi:MAG: VWA domain-containing protein, partial [Spartobacteria bacterium]|nr:VWA domain-containing protein [Spartobacteria bacterium]
MMAEDIKPNRLQQAKWGVRDLLQKLRGDRIGLLTFAGTSFLQCPLTVDYAAFLMTLDDVYAGILPRGGTAITKALQQAIDSFEYDTNADRAIILVTDGEDHEGDPARLIPELKKKNIRVYAVGVGTLQGELIPTSDPQGRLTFIKDNEGQVVKTALQEDAIRKVALETGGIYVRSAPGDFGLERIYDQGIDQLQRDEQESRMVKEYEERFMWFIAIALAMLLIESLLSNRTRKPQSASIVEEA